MPLRSVHREQAWLLPPTLDNLLPEDHRARFVAVFVDGLDHDVWARMEIDLSGDPLGAPAYHPRALLSLWIYGFMTGVLSSRKLEGACRNQISYLRRPVWLEGNTVDDPESFVVKSVLSSAYNARCSQDGRPFMNENRFGRTLKPLRPGITEGQRMVGGKLSWAWIGIGLKDEKSRQ